MQEINVIGLDLAKHIFHVYGVNRPGQPVVSRKLRRHQMHSYFRQLPPCLIGMESCATSHYWARELVAPGHKVKLIAPQFVKPYVKGNKNDCNDAEGICEALQRPTMRFVGIKTPEQQSVLHLHRSRQLLVKSRVSISNHIRGLLAEFGVVIPVGVKSFERQVIQYLEDESLPALSRHSIGVMWSAYVSQQAQIKELEQTLKRWHRRHEVSRRLAEVPGIGVHTATALVAALGDGRSFRHGRQVAAFIGLVPRQASRGGKHRLLGISKRGDGLLRRLLVQGAQSVLRHVRRRQQAGLPSGQPWLEALLKRKHPNQVAIALANKMARIAWVLLAREQRYCAATAGRTE